MFLTRDQIFSCDDSKTEIVAVPEWGGDVMVKSMTGTERDAFEASLLEQRKTGNTIKMENIRAKLVAKTLIDPDTKKLLFSVGDIDELGKKSASALDRIFTVAQRLSKLSDTDLEELAKN